MNTNSMNAIRELSLNEVNSVAGGSAEDLLIAAGIGAGIGLVAATIATAPAYYTYSTPVMYQPIVYTQCDIFGCWDVVDYGYYYDDYVVYY